MAAPDPNLPHLLAVAEALGDLREHVVFVGGSTAGLLLTDPLAESVRPTVDVDAVVQTDSLAHYYRIEGQLEERGFVRDAAGGVICRWQHRSSGVMFDLMPVDASILGFGNRWYDEVVATAQLHRLDNGMQIRLVSAPAFLATKLEAFADRGQGDFLSSHDLEDVLNVVDGRPELPDELAQASAPMRQTIATCFSTLLAKPDFINCLPGLLADPDRADIITARLQRIAAQR